MGLNIGFWFIYFILVNLFKSFFGGWLVGLCSEIVFILYRIKLVISGVIFFGNFEFLVGY